MSSTYAIAAVSAVLQKYLQDALADLTVVYGPVTVSAKAPDLVQHDIGDGSNDQNQVNLFLHQVTYNQAWRNVDLPSLGSNGTTLVKNPPLALDLHYLLTAYGSANWQAEALLGHALLTLHQFPVLARTDITAAIAAIPAGPLAIQLSAAGLADQIEQIKITPSPLNREEIAWLWTALKADYRPTFSFQTSVVLIQPETPLNLPFPVLSRMIVAHPVQPAQLLQVIPPDQQVSAAAGDTVTVEGQFLKGAANVVLTYARLGIQVIVPAANVTATSLEFTVPSDAATAPCPAGIYTLAVQIPDASGSVTQTTNSLPFAVAPVLQIAPMPVIQTGATTEIKATFSPAARPNQKVSLAIGSLSAPASAFETDQTTLTFIFRPPLTTGPQLARLVVDSSPSQIIVNWPTTPGGTPTFDKTFWVTI